MFSGQNEMIWDIGIAIVVFGGALFGLIRFGGFMDRSLAKRLSDLEKYPYPDAKGVRAAEILTRDLHEHARKALEDRPKRIARRGADIIPLRPAPPAPMRPIDPEDRYLDHPQIKRGPKKPALVESPRQPQKTEDDISILIGLQGFGGLVPAPVQTPEPDIKAGGGDAGGAGSSAMWIPDLTPSPPPQTEANTSADTSSGFDHSSGGHHD